MNLLIGLTITRHIRMFPKMSEYSFKPAITDFLCHLGAAETSCHHYIDVPFKLIWQTCEQKIVYFHQLCSNMIIYLEVCLSAPDEVQYSLSFGSLLISTCGEISDSAAT